MTADDSGNSRRAGQGTKLEQYLLMDEKEKDAEIQKAIVRLQMRIQTILYALETDMHGLDRTNEEYQKSNPRL